ncbi:MAG: SUMF1/EgtB/PvdO family nonheme iron enzyme [Bacteroidales bacterium]|nr:SUMF1/EgtB/PvdO family nonheme iron enzyme [Bacteroidales bacterium]MDZ4203517.1 SUMF1/EgtB/PvdO family nonheme iron enzyme [Bacteroidales bacterium]
MKRLIFYFAGLLLLASCSSSGKGELVGVSKRPRFYQPDPYGMVYIPMGSYTMGVGDENIPGTMDYQPKTVSVSAFYMDETEITNNEYRQFVHWVRDSIARVKLGESLPELYLIEENKKTGEVYDPPILNWGKPIKWNGEEEREILAEMFLPENERYFRRKEIDTRKLFYEYYWVDLRAAASKDYSGGDPKNAAFANRPQGMRDRSVYVRKETINIYPDTLVWLHDYSYSFNDPLAENYFWHPAFDHYPVVGVNWRQARAFSIWRTQYLNSFLASREQAIMMDFRLPTEAEWEWAARGGNALSPYPWGGPYCRNEKGCFLANFKPLRGDYAADGGLATLVVGHFPPNDFGLYDMAGNVAEWTVDAFHSSAYNFTWDMNPSYTFNAKDTDPPILKRKVVRGGSWKDVSYYLQNTTRSYEYQDTAKSYIGFRNVQGFLGRQKGDNPRRASKIYN